MRTQCHMDRIRQTFGDNNDDSKCETNYKSNFQLFNKLCLNGGQIVHTGIIHRKYTQFKNEIISRSHQFIWDFCLCLRVHTHEKNSNIFLVAKFIIIPNDWTVMENWKINRQGSFNFLFDLSSQIGYTIICDCNPIYGKQIVHTQM